MLYIWCEVSPLLGQQGGPPGALMPTLPGSAATVRVVTAEGDTPVPPPPGHDPAGHRCAALVCVDVYARPAP